MDDDPFGPPPSFSAMLEAKMRRWHPESDQPGLVAVSRYNALNDQYDRIIGEVTFEDGWTAHRVVQAQVVLRHLQVNEHMLARYDAGWGEIATARMNSHNLRGIIEQDLRIAAQTLGTNPTQAEEAPRMSYTPRNIPVITTSVALTSNGQSHTIGDLRLLIAEVERVGGTDESTFAYDGSNYRYNVGLVVKANEVTRPEPLTDGEKVGLLVEAVAEGTSEERRAEIKALLGL